MANPQVVVRPLQIPNLNAQQRAKALPFQAREIIALPLDEVILDFAQVGDPDPGTGMVSGLLIATPRRPVLAAVEAVERAGLKVARVDLSSFGALRSTGDEHLVVQAVIDLGAQLTSIVIHNHGVPKLVRTWPAAARADRPPGGKTGSDPRRGGASEARDRTDGQLEAAV